MTAGRPPAANSPGADDAPGDTGAPLARRRLLGMTALAPLALTTGTWPDPLVVTPSGWILLKSDLT